MARRFTASERTIVSNLQGTMKRIGATSLRISARNLMDPGDNQAEIVFDRGGRRYAVRCAKWKDYLDNFRAAERAIYYLYLALDSYGVKTEEGPLFAQFFSGFEATPDDLVLRLTSGSWWDVLGVDPNAGEADVKNAYRALAKVHHPDAGGDVDQWKRLARAYLDAIDATKGRANG